MYVYRLTRVLAGMALMLPLLLHAQAPAPAPEPTLRAMVETAWQRSPQVRALLARQDETAAGTELAKSWSAGPPQLGLSERSDRWTDQRQRRESEISLSAPIWLPGQKARRTDLAQAAAADSAAQLALAKLDVAGQVRTRYWAAASAREVAAEMKEHWEHLQELAADVERRTKAGDMARSDALLAQNEAALAQANFLAARRSAAEALSRFTLLTGQRTLPALAFEPAPPTTAAMPVRLQAAQAAERRARAAIAAASAQPSAAPTIAVAMRRERDGVAAPNDRSIGISLQIPLVGKQRYRLEETAAATQLAGVSADLAQAEAQLAVEIELARSKLADAEQAFSLAKQRAASMQEHTRLFEKAFKAGERSLAELLRSRILTHDAQVAVRLQQIALGDAHAGLNQVLGMLP